MASSEWRTVKCVREELNLAVLGLGQSFRWRRISRENGDDVVWQGIMANRVWRMKMGNEKLEYKVIGRFSHCQSSTDTEDSSILRDYFQLDTVPSVSDLYSDWSRIDPYFSSVVTRTPGIRVLRQDPIECLFSFICSTNNNIKRITSMVETLCKLYGEPLKIETGSNGSYHDQSESKYKVKRRKLSEVEQDERRIWDCNEIIEDIYYDFPTVTRLAGDDVEQELRKNGFGYRAKYVSGTAKMLLEEFNEEKNIRKSLNEFRTNCNLKEAKEFLLKFPGVGPKVADCVCLMALDKTEAVPVDTHVRTITAEKYMPNLMKKTSLTGKMYEGIGEFYRKLFGQYAGWAHSVLFSAKVAGKRQ